MATNLHIFPLYIQTDAMNPLLMVPKSCVLAAQPIGICRQKVQAILVGVCIITSVQLANSDIRPRNIYPVMFCVLALTEYESLPRLVD